MSASDTMHSRRANRRITSRNTSAPPKITSWRPAGKPSRRPRSAAGSAPRTSHHRATDADRQHRMVDPLPVVCRQSEFQAGERGHGAGQSDEPPGPTGVHQSPDGARCPVQLRPDGQDGRCRLGCRGWITAQEALREPNTANVEGHAPGSLPPPWSRSPWILLRCRGRRPCRRRPGGRPWRRHRTAAPLLVPTGARPARRRSRRPGEGTSSPLVASRTADVATRRARPTPSASMRER